MPMLTTCPACLGGLGDDPVVDTGAVTSPDSSTSFWQQLIGGWAKTGQQVILNQNPAYGTYTQSPTGAITYVQPEGSKTILPFTAGATVTTANLTAGTASKLSDTSTVLMVGLGAVAVFMLISVMKKKG